MFTVEKTGAETIITEDYAVELTKTGRGILAEVKDAGSQFNGTYALGSTRGCALAVLKAKIQEKQSQ
jgi:protein subunit release factor A